MTDKVVVTQTEQIAVSTVDTNNVTLTQTERVINTVDNGTVVLTGMMGPAGFTAVSDAMDVDTTNLIDGATLIYSTDVLKWQASNILEKQIMNAGFF